MNPGYRESIGSHVGGRDYDIPAPMGHSVPVMFLIPPAVILTPENREPCCKDHTVNKKGKSPFHVSGYLLPFCMSKIGINGRISNGLQTGNESFASHLVIYYRTEFKLHCE